MSTELGAPNDVVPGAGALRPSLRLAPRGVDHAFRLIVDGLGFGDDLEDDDPVNAFCRAFIDQASDQILLALASGEIIYANDAAVSALGVSRETLIGHRVAESHHRMEDYADTSRVLSKMLASITPEQPTISGARWHTYGGQRQFVDWKVRGVFRESVLMGLIMRGTDKTEQRLATEQLRRANRQLAESNRDLNEFAYVASHDLQEPLRKVLAFNDRAMQVAGDALDDRARDYLNRSQNAAKRMSQLISDVLTLSRVGSRGESMRPVDLREVARGVLGDLDVAVSSADATVTLGPLPTVEADPVQMRQLFQNLIGNALKFRRPDVAPVISISSESVRSGDGQEQWRITFSDNGIGFDQVHADRIFSVFQRLHGRSDYEGSGVGLSVCRRITDRHHGTIRAEARPGEGATFVVSLPAVQVAQTPG